MDDLKVRMRAAELEGAGDVGGNPTDNPTMGEVIAARFNRRDLLRGSLTVTAISIAVGGRALGAKQPAKTPRAPTFDFPEIEAGVDHMHHVAEGYDVQVLIRWGDPLFPDAPAFDPRQQTAAAQARQFGYNTDFLGFIPIDGSSSRGLLVANHEYTNEELMFPGVGVQDAKDVDFAQMTKDLVDIEMAAHGGSVLEIRREARRWQVVEDSTYTRRLTAETLIDITGPAAGKLASGSGAKAIERSGWRHRRLGCGR